MRGRASAKLLDSLRRILSSFFVNVYDADDSAMLGEADRDRLANATAPSGYQRHLVIKTKPAHV